ncbi:hypothetical protein [Hymenobacter lapidiphilus]|uniref:CzcB-like C-terminal circularly permuted SH3-like domain-containing protein n=1 Tax=Hymenobacter lapidiphilus TaxID=2608003 RepID=A0A7Y7U611_9BACT|nr:hypothetical protein [Hymenobacter lapidiphilus]NVO31872.1 hypothetical protein [Hymenobacter lapidiphilus]
MNSLRIPLVLAALLAGPSLPTLAQVYTPPDADEHPHPHPHPAPLRGPEVTPNPAAQLPLATISHTLYTSKSELYAESKPLIAGRPIRFTAHLTTLGASFRPYLAGQVTARLQVGGQTLTASVAKPEAPGIFRLQLPPAPAGTGMLVIDIVTPEFTDQFTIPGVVVYTDEAAARQLPRDERPGDISYIKEKSWLLPDFATQPLGRGTVTKGATNLTNVLVLPLTAFVNIGGRPHVYVQRTGERFELRPVQTGPGDGRQVQLLSGVQEGERVIIGGAREILGATVPAEHGHSH